MAEKDRRTTEYRGSVFAYRIKEHVYRMEMQTADNCIITDIPDHKESVEIPGAVEGSPVTKLELERDSSGSPKVYPGVKRLVIPAHVGRIDISNLSFPDLEELVTDEDNEIFATDGRMLLRKDGEKRMLLRVLAAGRDREITLKREVSRICDRSFEGSSCIKIRCEGDIQTVEPFAFTDSAWLKHGEGVLFCNGGKTLSYYSPENRAPAFTVPEGTEYINTDAFPDHAGPSHLILPASFLGFSGDHISSFSNIRRITAAGQVPGLFRFGAEDRGLFIPVVVSIPSPGIESFSLPPDLMQDALSSGDTLPDNALYDRLIRDMEDVEERDLPVLLTLAGPRKDLDGHPFYRESAYKRTDSIIRKALDYYPEQILSGAIRRGYFDRDVLRAALPALGERGWTAAVSCALGLP